MRIVFFGSAEFGIPALQILIERHNVVAVVSTPAKPAGRGLTTKDSPVTDFARNKGITPIYTPEAVNEPEFLEKLVSLKADCFIVVAFRIIPACVFSIPPFGTLNIHASLLPAYRGPAPIQRAIEAGETRSGVTVFRIDEGIDTGEILEQAEVQIGAEETSPQLSCRLSVLGADTLCSVLEAFERGEIIRGRRQQGAASRAPKLKKEEALIDWSLPAVAIFNKIRAFKPYPGTHTLVNGKRLGIEWARPISPGEIKGPCGMVIRTASDSFDVQAGEGALRIESVKPEGRKVMSAGDYLRGTALIKEGFQFGG